LVESVDSSDSAEKRQKGLCGSPRSQGRRPQAPHRSIWASEEFLVKRTIERLKVQAQISLTRRSILIISNASRKIQAE
jgi:hypothetical protein